MEPRCSDVTGVGVRLDIVNANVQESQEQKVQSVRMENENDEMRGSYWIKKQAHDMAYDWAQPGLLWIPPDIAQKFLDPRLSGFV